MDHNQAVTQMATERYLLNELEGEEREAYEAHVFECGECALDLRAGAAFVDEAKVQLPDLLAAMPDAPPTRTRNASSENRGWFSWMLNDWPRAAFAVPTFALLMLVVGYQNLVTFPRLRASANQPQLLASVPLHGATRGGEGMTINADRSHGLVLPFEFFRQPETPVYGSYVFELSDSANKLAWTGTIAATDDKESDDQRISLVIPGSMLENSAYTVVVYGVGSQGGRTEIEKQAFDLHLTN